MKTMNTIRNTIDTILLITLAIPLIITMVTMTPDFRYKITQKVLENF